MAKQYNECLQRYHLTEFDPNWAGVLRGIEKESLRVSPEGYISQSSHPIALGSALTNPFITTDFSESLLEFITPAYTSIDECLKILENIHRFTLQNLEQDEILWVASMPCPLSDDAGIPIAQYGNSNIGKLKTLYRQGLSNRYGSLMQSVSGIHYNFSMPEAFWEPYQKICGDTGSLQDFRTDKYLSLIRNFHRYSWLLIYLFGASPAACKCFVQGREHNLEELDEHTLYLPNATCLRMGNLGYKSEAQKSLFVCYNELESYVECLHEAMHTSYPDYESIGQKKDGQYLQINTKLLQLENEFYSTIRPKRNVESNERPLEALTRAGIEYVEIRALDLNPYLPLGIDAEQSRFIDSFLLHCLLAESTECHEQEFFEVTSNVALVVEHGRDPELNLTLDGTPKSLKDWANELLADIAHSSALLDQARNDDAHGQSLAKQQAKVDDPARTPSGQILAEMKDSNISFFDFSMEKSKLHGEYFKNNGIDDATVELMQKTSNESIAAQKTIEAADEITFDKFLQRWNDS